MSQSVKVLLVHLAVGLLVAAAESIREYESGKLCAGRKPFTFYGDVKSRCTNYFWCSPEHAACMMTCPAGTVFNQACNCCQNGEAVASLAFDKDTCSTAAVTKQQQADAAEEAPARQLLAAEPAKTTTSSSSGSSKAVMKAKTGWPAESDAVRAARAKARLARRRRREAEMKQLQAAAASPASSDKVASKAALSGAGSGSISSADGTSAGRVLPEQVKRRVARRAARPSGVWNSYGKKYSGRWADRNVVKEPAVRSSATATSSTAERHLLDTDVAAAATTTNSSSQPASASLHMPAATRRSMQMKRVQRLANLAATAAATAGDPAAAAATGDTMEQKLHGGEHHKFVLRHKLRPMDKKPAAKTVDPEDEKQAPFAEAVAHHHQLQQQQRPQQHKRVAHAGTAAAGQTA